MSEPVARPKPGLTRSQLVVLAHELRGALTVVAGYSDLLTRDLDEEDRASALEGVQRAVQRADGLIQSALLGDIEGKNLAFSALDLAELAVRVADEQRAATGREVTVIAQSNPRIAGDADALSRMLGNLIDNAAKYSQAPAPVEVRVAQSDGSAVISVSDRGPGIAEEDRERAFQPFERLGQTDAIEGSGVGLAVVQSVAGSHGGAASIGPREGGGTTVRVELPLST